MGSYRCKLDIIADMLQVVNEGSAKKTQIMYQANLSYKLLTKYLTEVTESRLIRFDNKNQSYTLTSKGKQFLEKHKEYSRRNRHLEKRLNDLQSKREVLEKLCSNK